MTNFSKAVEIAAEGIRRDAAMYEIRLEEVEGWSDLLGCFGQDSAEMKEDIRLDLVQGMRNGELEPFSVLDDCSIEDSDGSIKTYRQLTNAMRKQLFA